MNLEDVFNGFIFNGFREINEKQDLTLKLLHYDTETGLIIGKGDDVNGPSAITGDITPKEGVCNISFEQKYPKCYDLLSFEAPRFKYDGTIQKKGHNLIMEGSCINQTTRERGSWYLEVAPEGPAYGGWNDGLKNFELPK